jgi:hypothetical protein
MIGVVDDKKDFIFQFSDQWRDSGRMGQIFYIFYLDSDPGAAHWCQLAETTAMLS